MKPTLNQFGEFCRTLFLWLFYAVLATAVAVLPQMGTVLWGLPLFLLAFCAVAGTIRYLPPLAHPAWWLFGLSLVVTLVAVFTIDTPIASDFLTQYQAAQALKAGTFDLAQSPYFNQWPYQLGLSLIEAGLLNVVNSVLVLKLLNALLVAGTTVVVYHLIKLFSDAATAQVGGLLYALFPTPILFSTLLTNNIGGGFFSTLSVLFFVWANRSETIRHHLLWLALSLITLGVAYFVRPDAVVFLIAYVVYYALRLVGQAPRQLGFNVLAIFVLIISFTATKAGFDAGVRVAGVAPQGLINPDPAYRLATGLYLPSNGRYSAELVAKIDRLEKQGQARQTTSQQQVQKNLQMLKTAGPRRLWAFITSKQGLYVFGFQNGLSFVTDHMRPSVAKALNIINTLYIVTIVLLALVGAYWLVKRDSLIAIIPAFVVFVGVASNLLNEVQYRYSYSLQPLLFVMAAVGLLRTLEWWRGLHQHSNVTGH